MARRRQRNRPRPLRNALIVLLVSITTAELSPYALGRFLGYGAFDRDDVQASLGTALSVDTVRTERPAEEYLGDHFLHPYLGYVSVPLNDRNRFGLPGADPLMPASPDTVNMALLGGSVAMGLHTFSEQRLIKGLQRIPRFKGKPFRVTVFALGGFKQPQPLLALNYFLAQGAHYDVIITLDGFNDIVLPFCDNLGVRRVPLLPQALEHVFTETARSPRRACAGGAFVPGGTTRTAAFGDGRFHLASQQPGAAAMERARSA
ncbi:MAG: hypothetical protein IPK99_02650 [Flavobacteriales bacterium]|nr:hypothetical protein [Flavobacteriales bacterium]